MPLLSSPTLTDMLQQVRYTLKQPDPNNSNWSDDELLSYANEAIRIYFAELANIGEGYFTATVPLDLVAGQEEIALPADFFKIRALYKIQSQESILLSYRNNLTDSYFTDGGNSSNVYAPYYYFRGNNIVLRPLPQFTETGSMILEYIQFPETLLNGADQLTAQISPVFRQVIEMYVVFKAKFAESLVTGTNTYSIAKDHLADLLKQFRDLNAVRSKTPTYAQAWNPEG
jgi:hypothetical protein